MNILFLRAGIYSNLNQYLLQAMKHSHHVVENVDAGRVIRRKSMQFSSMYNILYTLFNSGIYYKQTHSKNSYAFQKMTAHCDRHITARNDYDIIFQTQCKFSITKNERSKPYFIYTDLTQKITEKVWPKWSLRSNRHEVQKWYSLETDAYNRATKIFTFNEYIKQSFLSDYQIPEDKVVVVGSGVNHNGWINVDIRNKEANGFTLFFLTTEFERQGGLTVVKAFEHVKKKCADIRLIIGGNCPSYLPKDIIQYPNLTRDTIEKLFDETSVFLLPGHLGGLQSVLEAMCKKCTCIVGDSNFLLYDIIKDGETGYVVQTDNDEQLAAKIIDLYHNLALARTVAENAYNLVQTNHTWEKIVGKMTTYFERA
ncbi:glycosyltransferase family 4 protein [candidate division KSB1 bacterium]|nr:glycosyltransferase family 4 protein [candidate division KSB1 bacterium]